MTELSNRIKNEVDKGISIRAIARKAGMSDNTVRRARDGYELDRATKEKFSRYFKVPIEEVYRMAGDLPSKYDDAGDLNDNYIMSEMWKAINQLTYSEQLRIYSEIMGMLEEHGKSGARPSNPNPAKFTINS